MCIMFLQSDTLTNLFQVQTQVFSFTQTLLADLGDTRGIQGFFFVPDSFLRSDV